MDTVQRRRRRILSPSSRSAVLGRWAGGLALLAGLGSSCTSKRSPPPSSTGAVQAATTGGATTTTTATATATTVATSTTTGDAAAPPAGPRPRPATLATSGEHVCALLTGGEVACWGSGHGGQVAPSVVENQPEPIKVPGLRGAIGLTVSKRVSCALLEDSEVVCWGAYALRPERRLWRTRLLGDAVQIVASSYGAELCGLRKDGTVACIDRVFEDREPARILSIDDGISLSRNGAEFCALRASKSLDCWNTRTGESGYRPKSIASGVVEAENSGSAHCYRLEDGTQHCSSYKGYEAVAPIDGPLWKAKAPPELWTETVDHAGTYGFDCIRDSKGAVKCKGKNKVGQLGNGRTGYSPTPRPFFRGMVADTIAGVELGGTVSCVREREGGLRCEDHVYSLENPEVAGVRSAAVGGSHSCAVVGGGQLRCWGDNYDGQLGREGEFEGIVRVEGISNASHVAVGEHHTCASRRDGAVFCWGSGDYGELGDHRHIDMDSDAYDMDDEGIRSTVPLRVDGVRGPVQDLALGEEFSCAATPAGLYCWGLIPDATDGVEPTYDMATLLSDVDATMLRASGASLCALDRAGGVRCLGLVATPHVGLVDPIEGGEDEDEDEDYDEYEDDGDEEPWLQGGPLWRIDGGPGTVTDIAVGNSHACVLGQGGSVHCWGDNTTGQLGDGSSRQREGLVKVQGLSGVLDIDAGSAHTCARLADGISCWGQGTSPKEHRQSMIFVPVVGLAPYLMSGLQDQAAGESPAVAGAGAKAPAKAKSKMETKTKTQTKTQAKTQTKAKTETTTATKDPARG